MILVIIALAGLYTTELVLPKAPSSSPSPLPDPTLDAGDSMTVDERLTQVGKEWPGFGGYFLERANLTPPYEYGAYVYMLDACQQEAAEAAEAAAKQMLGAERFGQDILWVTVVQGDYSIVQLSQWYEYVSRITDPGLVLTDLDESRNRLEIGVVDDAAAQRVEEKLKELPTPREAVAIRIKEPVRLYESAGDPVGPTEGDDQLSDALLQDLETIARQKGISLEAAIDRYGSQGSFLALLDTIRETFPNDYAWARVGVFGHGLVGFAGRPPAAALWMIDAFVKNRRGASVEVQAHLGFSELEKNRAISAFHYAIYEAPEVSWAGTGLDPATGHLRTTVWLEDAACNAAVLDDLRASATKALIDATRADILNSIKIDVSVVPSSGSGSVDGPVLTSPQPDGRFGGMDGIVRGIVVFDESAGCLYLGSSSENRKAVVWPAGASWQADPPAVKIHGQLIEPGMSVEGGGGYVLYESIKAFAGTAVADAAQACADPTGPTADVALFNVGSEVDVVP